MRLQKLISDILSFLESLHASDSNLFYSARTNLQTAKTQLNDYSQIHLSQTCHYICIPPILKIYEIRGEYF